jgi:hypothetical protein
MIRGKIGGKIIGVMFMEKYSSVRFEAEEVWTLYKDGRLYGSYMTTSKSGKRGTSHGVSPTSEEFHAAVNEAVDRFVALQYRRET